MADHSILLSDCLHEDGFASRALTGLYFLKMAMHDWLHIWNFDPLLL